MPFQQIGLLRSNRRKPKRGEKDVYYIRARTIFYNKFLISLIIFALSLNSNQYM